MSVITEIESYKDNLIYWRRDIHGHPELTHGLRSVFCFSLRRNFLEIMQ